MLKGVEMKSLKEKVNKRYFEISLYVIFTCVVVYLLSRLSGQLPLILKTLREAVGWFGIILRPVIIGFVIAYLLFPVLGKIERLLKKIKLLNKKENVRGLAVGLLCLLIALLIFLVVSMLVSLVTKQIRTANTSDIIEAVKSYTGTINKLYWDLMAGLENLNINSEEIKTAVDGAMKSVGKYLLGISSGLGGLVNNIMGVLTTILFAVIFSIYFMLDMPLLKRYWGRVLKVAVPARAGSIMKTVVSDADSVFAGYIRGQLIDAFCVGVTVSVVFSIIGIQYAVVIGLLVGLGNLVPYMGPILGYGSLAVVGIATADYKNMFIAAILLLIIQAVDANFIYPKLLSSSISIHPMVVIISLLIGGKVGGLLGMLLAVPFGALAKVWFERLIDLAENRNNKERSKEVE